MNKTKKQQKEFKKGDIIIYKTPDKKAGVDVILSNETVWLRSDQIVDLFDRDKSVISRHIKNVFEEKELYKNAVVAKFATTAVDGKTYNVAYYNLDVIISVGYRVKSRRGVQFRIWATKILKEHLVRGYTVNEKRLLAAQEKFKELQNAVNFLHEKSKNELLMGQEQEILNLLSNYSKSLTLLEQYDKSSLKTIKEGRAKFILEYTDAIKIIAELKKELLEKGEAGDLFGSEYKGKFEGIVSTLCQTFDKKELYGSVEEKAAHLFYLAIKDHPFTDGNKRIASFLFVYFLDKNNYLYKDTHEKKINDNALVALALLIAISDPKDKEVMVKIVTNLLNG